MILLLSIIVTVILIDFVLFCYSVSRKEKDDG